jgi:glycosyltransferase involved in cell wall biosynthesis
MMRLAFVVQRYGLDVHGGAEMECRLWAERLATRHEVHIFTTCARDYLTWADYYQPGTETINGVHVHRFGVDAPRDVASFNQFSHVVFGGSHSDEQEWEWMRRQGPLSSALLQAIAARRDEFDLWIFMTYLYATTAFGLPLVADRAVLTPTAHDEFTIYLRIFRRIFGQARYLLYNTAAEARFLRRLYPDLPLPGAEIGLGVDLPPLPSMGTTADPPTLLYVGRVHTSKNCEQLYEYTLRYKAERRSPLQLVFAGRADIALPEHPHVLHLGYVSDHEKQRWLEQCTLLVQPSAVESLSIVCLEAWAAGKPTLVNAASEVLREQSVRSDGGLFYRDYDEFAACLDLLLADDALRAQLGQQGRRFVERRYSWPVVEQRLEASLQQALLYTEQGSITA